MSAVERCPKCGGPLPAEGAPGAGCPRCQSAEADFQRTITVAPTAAAAPSSAAEQRMPAMIGRYRIVRLIGEGGMGAVYEAEQDQPRRTVALKVIRPGMASPALLRRFEQEAQALGRLQHPGIAQIYEAGTADTGFGPQPYFAMEFIRGASLRDYVEEHHLHTRQRLEMMAKVCDAVHHAHQRSLIHRDLKPGNILVDENGQPKILDFGVARVTDRDAQATSQTDVGQLIGTLAYMSPEQVLADPLELDTRSDVYALGVILYELLAGQLPYNIGNKLHEALHAIREQDPSRLSSVSHAYKGDVETIVAKALEKDKARRYSSAADLAADIRRYLTDEPIEARPPSLSYQLQKFARRHKALVAGVAAVFVVLVTGIAASSWQAVRASRAEQAAVLGRDRAVQAEKTTALARDQAVQAQAAATAAEAQARKDRDQAVAEKKRADTEAASELAASTFWQQDLVAQARDGELTMRAALDQAAARVTSDQKQPLVEAKVRETVAKAYISLSAWAPAQEQIERALAIRRRVQGDEHSDTLDTNVELAELYARTGRSAEAESLFTRIIGIRRRVQGKQHPDTLNTLIVSGQLYLTLNQFDKAEPLLKEASESRRMVLGPEHRDTLTAMMLLAACYMGQRKLEPARQLFKTVVEVSSRRLGEKDSLTVGAASLLKTVETVIQLRARQTQPTKDELFSLMNDAAKAIPSDFRSLTEMAQKTNVEAQSLLVAGKFEQAVELLNSRLDIARRAGVENGSDAASLWYRLGQSYDGLKKYPEAESNYLKSIEISGKALGPEDPNVLTFTKSLAEMYRNQGRFADAEVLLAKVVQSERRAPGDGAQATRVDMDELAQIYAEQAKYVQAEEMFNQLLEAQRRAKSPAVRIADTQSSIGWVRLRQKRYAEAEAVLREAASLVETVTPAPWEKFNIQSMLGASLAAQKKYAEAEPLLLSGYDGMKQRQPSRATTNRFTGEQAGSAVVDLYQAWGKPERAAEWKNKLPAGQ